MHILSKKSVNNLIKTESRFGQIVDEFGLPENWLREEGFQTICRIILEQQVSLESAFSAWRQLQMRLDDINPVAVLSLDQHEMRTCYISRQKAKYLHALSESILDGNLTLDDLSQKPPEEVIEHLIQVKGIGPWTAQVYLIFALRSPDIYPKGDVALNNAVKELWNLSTNDLVYIKSEEWAPYRTTASFLLWHHYLSVRGRDVSKLYD